MTEPPRCRFHNGHNAAVLAKAQELAINAVPPSGDGDGAKPAPCPQTRRTR